MLKPSFLTAEQFAQYKRMYPIFHCSFSGCSESNPDEETIDHIVSRATGGTHDLSNLQPMCRRHNSMKGTRDDSYWSQHFYFDSAIAIENLRASQRQECYDRIIGMPEWFSRPFSQISQVLYTLAWVVGSGKTLAIPTLAFGLNNVIRRERGPNAQRIDRILVLSKEQAIRDQIRNDLRNDIARYGICNISPNVGIITHRSFLDQKQLIDQFDIWNACINMLFENNTPIPNLAEVLNRFPLIIIDEPHYAVEQVLRIVQAAQTSLCFGLTGSPIEADGRQLRKFVLFSTFDYYSAHEFDQSMKYLVPPDDPDWSKILEVVGIRSADLQRDGQTITVESTEDADYWRNVRPAMTVAESVVRYVHECDETYPVGFSMRRYDAAPHREGIDMVADLLYDVHAMIKVETIEIGKVISDHLNKLFESDRSKFPAERGYRCEITHSDRTDLDENGITKAEKGKKLSTDHSWLHAKNNKGELTATSARFLVVVGMGREGLDNSMCGVVGVACHVASLIDMIQRAFGRQLRSFIKRSGGTIHVPPARLDTVKIITHEAFDNVAVIEQAAQYILDISGSLDGLPTMSDLMDGRHAPDGVEDSNPNSHLSSRDKLVIAGQIGSLLVSGRERTDIDVAPIANLFGPSQERVRKAGDWAERVIGNPGDAGQNWGLVAVLREVNRVVREAPSITPTDETLITFIRRVAPHLADCCNRFDDRLIRSLVVDKYIEHAKQYHRGSITSMTSLKTIKARIFHEVKGQLAGYLQCEESKLHALVATAMRMTLGVPKEEKMRDGEKYDIPESHVILTRPEVDRGIKGWVIRTLAANGYCPALAAAFQVQEPAEEPQSAV